MNVQDVLLRDAIPSIDDPSFRSTHFGDDDDVIVVEGDPPRAYPVRILGYHEIVNDVILGAFSPSTAARPIRSVVPPARPTV